MQVNTLQKVLKWLRRFPNQDTAVLLHILWCCLTFKNKSHILLRFELKFQLKQVECRCSHTAGLTLTLLLRETSEERASPQRSGPFDPQGGVWGRCRTQPVHLARYIFMPQKHRVN